jgi:hypothetical protein
VIAISLLIKRIYSSNLAKILHILFSLPHIRRLYFRVVIAEWCSIYKKVGFSRPKKSRVFQVGFFLYKIGFQLYARSINFTDILAILIYLYEYTLLFPTKKMIVVKLLGQIYWKLQKSRVVGEKVGFLSPAAQIPRLPCFRTPLLKFLEYHLYH